MVMYFSIRNNCAACNASHAALAVFRELMPDLAQITSSLGKDTFSRLACRKRTIRTAFAERGKSAQSPGLMDPPESVRHKTVFGKRAKGLLHAYFSKSYASGHRNLNPGSWVSTGDAPGDPLLLAFLAETFWLTLTALWGQRRMPRHKPTDHPWNTSPPCQFFDTEARDSDAAKPEVSERRDREPGQPAFPSKARHASNHVPYASSKNKMGSASKRRGKTHMVQY
jgi:hypothetical protein